MVLSCVAYNCTNRMSKVKDGQKSLSFHRFPLSKPNLLKEWLTRVRRENWAPTKHSRLCSAHFTEDSFMTTEDGPEYNASRRKLKDNAVPTVFNIPKYLLKPLKRERPLPSRNSPIQSKKKCISTSDNISEHEPNTLTSFATNDSTSIGNDLQGPVLKDSSPSSPMEFPRILKKPKTTVSAKPNTPTKLRGRIAKLQKRLKHANQKVRRKNKSVTNLKELISNLKKAGNPDDFIMFSGFPLEFCLNTYKNSNCVKPSRKYSNTMKQFALTLYFYSPKAYRYVRTLFPLPHPSRIRSWVSKLNCQPGFMEEVFEYIKQNITEMFWLKDCVIIMDSMSIRKQTVWDSKAMRYSGFVDCAGIGGDGEVLASEALVIMVVSLTRNFKCPIGYFLVDKVSANVQSQILNVALSKLYNVGVRIWSITSDGASANVCAFKQLGCEFEVDCLRPYFYHSEMGLVYCVLDPCHMLKLARNTLSDKGTLVSLDGEIKWSYIVKLHELQTSEGLKFSNKLSGQHVRWSNKKMNVALAVQTLSSSVADALKFLRLAGHPDFRGSKPTENFICQLDCLFDILNTRNPFGKGFKKPLYIADKAVWMARIESATEFLRGIKLDGISIVEHQRKTFAVGLISAASAIMNLALKLLTKEITPMKYILTYKFSQDHIEIFFSCIRSMGGFNNNPNTLQFKWALRKLVFRNSVVSSGNCASFDTAAAIPIVEFRSDKRAITPSELAVINQDDEDMMLKLSAMLDSERLTEYQENILAYVAGWLVKKILCKLSCSECRELLYDSDSSNHDHIYASRESSCRKFIQSKTRGSLINPSDGVIKVVVATEKVFRRAIIDNEKCMNQKGIHRILISAVRNHFFLNSSGPFSHSVANELVCEDLHEFQLVTKITESFLSLRLKTYCQQYTLKVVKEKQLSLRQKLHKLILFQNV